MFLSLDCSFADIYPVDEIRCIVSITTMIHSHPKWAQSEFHMQNISYLNLHDAAVKPAVYSPQNVSNYADSSLNYDELTSIGRFLYKIIGLRINSMKSSFNFIHSLSTYSVNVVTFSSKQAHRFSNS